MATNETHNTVRVAYVAAKTDPAFTQLIDAPMVVCTAAGAVRLPDIREGAEITICNDAAGSVDVNDLAGDEVVSLAAAQSVRVLGSAIRNKWIVIAIGEVG